MSWKVKFTENASKQLRALPEKVQLIVRLLVSDLEMDPAVKWHNYSKLKSGKNMDKRHCHLKKGKPTYVCCWEVTDKVIKIIEVYYVGTHEGAPY